LSAHDSRETALLCARAALEKKAADVVLLDIHELTALADYFLICTARSDTQAQAIAENIRKTLAEVGETALRVEGFSAGQWILIDYGDVAVHVFLEEVRAFYDLERLWARARVVPLPETSRAGDLHSAGGAR
jgi:ribosome-associated protein